MSTKPSLLTLVRDVCHAIVSVINPKKDAIAFALADEEWKLVDAGTVNVLQEELLRMAHSWFGVSPMGWEFTFKQSESRYRYIATAKGETSRQSKRKFSVPASVGKWIWEITCFKVAEHDDPDVAWQNLLMAAGSALANLEADLRLHDKIMSAKSSDVGGESQQKKLAREQRKDESSRKRHNASAIRSLEIALQAQPDVCNVNLNGRSIRLRGQVAYVLLVLAVAAGAELQHGTVTLEAIRKNGVESPAKRVCDLRRRLIACLGKPDANPIENIRGKGYRLNVVADAIQIDRKSLMESQDHIIRQIVKNTVR